MKAIDPGHVYGLSALDGDGQAEFLKFVKREGGKFPGNVGHHSGTTTQEVLRVLIDRTKYVNNQIDFPENHIVLGNLRYALWLLECRAARTHNRYLKSMPHMIELVPTCKKCGHIECEEHLQ